MEKRYKKKYCFIIFYKYFNWAWKSKRIEERIRILEEENSYLKDPRKILIEIIKYNLSKEEYDIAGKNLKELKMLRLSSIFKEEISILEKEILYYENLKKEKNQKW